MKTDTANEIAEALTEMLETYVDRMHGFVCEMEAEDEEGWPIAAWDLEEKEDEIAKVLVKIRIWITDDNRDEADDLIADIVREAKELGHDLEQAADCRWSNHGRQGIQINLNTPEIQ